MTFREYLTVLRERWLAVALTVVLMVGAGAATWFLRPKEYTAELTLYVSAQTADNAQSAYQGAQLSQQRVASYVDLVSSTRVSGDVVRALRLPTDPTELAERIHASSDVDSVVIRVSATDRSPRVAADIANAVARVFIGLVDELERPSSPGARPPVAVRVVEPAAEPREPSSTSLPLMLAIGLAVGLVLGVGLAFWRNALDTTVKSRDALRRAAGVPVLGTISFDPEVSKRPLTVHEAPRSPRSEAFRQLRTNLQFVSVDRPRQVIVITSSVPSEGKTTTLANLAIALASAGHRTLVVDADLRRPRLAELLGLERSVGLTTVLAGRVPLGQAIQHWSGGVDVLASGPLPPNPSELLASRQMATLISELRRQYDSILIDTPPLLPVTDAAAVAPVTDGVVLTCRFHRTTRDQLLGAVQSLTNVSAAVLGTVLTMATGRAQDAYGSYEPHYATNQPIEPISPAVGTPTAGARATERFAGVRRAEHFAVRQAPRPHPREP